SYTMNTFTPSTAPGCRTPHVWLADGGSLYDRLGPGYTLLRFDRRADVGDVMANAAARGVPLRLLDLDTTGEVYDRKLVLARPDGHVAWRGDAPPEDAAELIDQIRGAAPRRARQAA